MPDKKPIPDDPSKHINEIVTRLRMLEERYSALRKKDQFSEHTMLKDTKEIFQEIKLINETINELKMELSEFNEKITKLAEEVSGSVKKKEFDVLVKYLEYWEPLEFVTRNEAKKMLQQERPNTTG